MRVAVILLLSLYRTAVSAETLKFGLINGGSDFFEPVNHGWTQRCEELGVTCYQTYPGDDANYTVNGEYACMNHRNAVIAKWRQMGLNGIAMKPCTFPPDYSQNLTRDLEASGIPVVFFDSDIKESERVAYVGTDQSFLGRTLARLLRQLRPDGGRYALIGRKQERCEGFIDEISRYNDRNDRAHWFEIEGDYTSTVGNGTDYMGMMERAALLEPEAIIFFKQTPMRHENYTQFVQANRDKQITFIGTDGDDYQLEYLSRRYVDGLIGQLPYEFGTDSAQALFDFSEGRPVKDVITTNIVAYNLIPLELPHLEVDQNLLGNLKYVGYVCFGLVAASVVFCFTWTACNRSTLVVRVAQPFFLMMVAVGVLIMSSSLIPLSSDDGGDMEPESHRWSVGICMSIPWLAFTGFAVTFSALFSKTWRVNRIMKAKISNKRIKLSAQDVMAPFAVLLFSNIIVLVLWTVLNPLQYIRQEHDGTDYWNRTISTYGACRSDNAVAFLGPLAVINLTVILTACWQAVQARNIQSEFAETKYIGLAVASLLQAFLTGIPVIVVVRDMPQAYYLVMSVMIFLLSMVLLWLIFLPKMMTQRRYAKMSDEEQRQELGRGVRDQQQPSSAGRSSGVGFRSRADFDANSRSDEYYVGTPTTASPADDDINFLPQPSKDNDVGLHSGKAVGFMGGAPVVSEITRVYGLSSVDEIGKDSVVDVDKITTEPEASMPLPGDPQVTSRVDCEQEQSARVDVSTVADE